MESKIVIDIRDSGEPFIFINFKGSEDLRDKVLGRFLYETGAAQIQKADGSFDNPKPLTLHVLYRNEETGDLQAMIENPGYDGPGKTPIDAVDEICKELLDHDQYTHWLEICKVLDAKSIGKKSSQE